MRLYNIITEIRQVLKTLLLHQKLGLIKIPIQLEVGYVNVLLHTFDIFKMNENLHYTIHDGSAVILQERTKNNDTQIIAVFSDLNMFNKLVNVLVNKENEIQLKNLLTTYIKTEKVEEIE